MIESNEPDTKIIGALRQRGVDDQAILEEIISAYVLYMVAGVVLAAVPIGVASAGVLAAVIVIAGALIAGAVASSTGGELFDGALMGADIGEAVLSLTSDGSAAGQQDPSARVSRMSPALDQIEEEIRKLDSTSRTDPHVQQLLREVLRGRRLLRWSERVGPEWNRVRWERLPDAQLPQIPDPEPLAIPPAPGPQILVPSPSVEPRGN